MYQIWLFTDSDNLLEAILVFECVAGEEKPRIVYDARTRNTEIDGTKVAVRLPDLEDDQVAGIVNHLLNASDIHEVTNELDFI